MYINDTGFDGLDWIKLDQGRIQWETAAKTNSKP